MDKVLITGGAGFVGTNLADRLMRAGARVTVFDNLARRGTERNLEWLRQQHGSRLRFVRGDVRDAADVAAAVRDCDTIFHFAAQVAVTTSLTDPRHDFEVNALGTLNVLEAARQAQRPPAILFTSTNKVYGGLEGVPLLEQPRRWAFADRSAVDENQILDFHSPYGCSKGTADQYVRDYARIYGLKTVVFRMSCIYGPRQFGNEDQGWVAHFLISAARDRPITIYGDGKQVRDILFVEDLVDAFLAARERIDDVAGEVLNIGGGPENTLAIWTEFAPLIRRLTGRLPGVDRGAMRPGDQPIYVSDIRKAEARLGWKPRVGVIAGCGRLYNWIMSNSDLFGLAVPASPGRAARAAATVGAEAFDHYAAKPATAG
ncbi:MAG TPA: SDR family NAD(P)-dependent oxidoreductase [Chloroflexia bacterium]|nr:SDR family NAD(P)-dependent oxidoreductase [Chloroflexia bacterium]